MVYRVKSRQQDIAVHLFQIEPIEVDMSFFKNESGVSLVSVLVLGATLLGTSVVLLKQGDIAESRRKFQNYQDQENSFEKSINNFLSSKDNCRDSFANMVGLNSAGALTVNSSKYSDLKKNLSSSGDAKIIFDDLDFDINKLVQKSPNSTTILNDISEKLYVESSLELKLKRQNTNSIKMFSKTENVKNISLPIQFEFFKDVSGWKLVSCHSNHSNLEIVKLSQADCTASSGSYNADTQKCTRNTVAYVQRKNNCESNGGVLDSQNICRIKTNNYEIKNNILVTNSIEKYTIQDSLCILDHGISKQYSASTTSELFSQFCPRVKYGGCVVNNSPNWKTGDSGTIYLGKNKGGALQSTITKVFEDGVNARTERIATQLRVVDSLKSAGVNLNNSYADNSFKENKSNYSKYAVGAALFGGVGLVVAYFADAIFNCDQNRQIYANQVCKNGKIEVNHVYTMKEKFKCKKWSCKCRWVNDVTQVAPTEAEIAKALLSQGNLAISTPKTENVVTEDNLQAEADSQIADIKADLDSSTSLENFYEKMSKIDIENETSVTANQGGLGQTYTNKLKAIVKAKEIAMWNSFNSQISINVATNSLNTVFNYLKSSLTKINSFEPKLSVANKDDTSLPAKNKISTIEKNLVNHLLNKMNNSTTKSELEAIDPAGYSSRFTQLSSSEVAVLTSTYNTNFAKY